MASVGEKLRLERERRNMTIDEMVAATGIGQRYLEALERGDVRELPGRAFGKLYIRAYAEVLGFDAQPWIDDYDREARADPSSAEEPLPLEPIRPRAVEAAIAQWRETRRKGRAEPEREAPPAPATEPASEAPPRPVPEDAAAPAPPAARPILRSRVVLAFAGLLVCGAAVYFVFFAERPPAPAPVAQPAAAPRPATPPATSRPPPSPPPVALPPAKPLPPAAASGRLTVSEFGVGRRVVDSRLEDEGDRFAPGDRVTFATRVIGARPGDVVRHVWLWEGKAEQTIALRLGGPDWRTHSNKTLGKAGSWTVEAKDGAGRVLATASFTCVPRGR